MRRPRPPVRLVLALPALALSGAAVASCAAPDPPGAPDSSAEAGPAAAGADTAAPAGADPAGVGIPPPIPVIDAHLHTRFTGGRDALSGIPETRVELMAQLRRANVVGGVSHTDSAGRGFSEALAREGIVFCHGVGSRVDPAALEEALASGRFRCLKIYLGYVPRYPTDPAYEPVYALAARFDVPVVFHTGDTATPDALVKYAHPLDIDEVAVRHRDVTFVIAHAGNPWFESAAEVTYKNPNVVLEASAILAGDLGEHDPEAVETLMVEPLRRLFLYVEDPSKIMFASDWPVTDIASYVEAYRRAIPREHWPAVFHDNAARVFGIEPR